MKIIFMFFILLAFLGCKENAKDGVEENAIFETSFRDYRELEVLEGFEKVSDTSIYERRLADNTFRLMELQKGEDHLVLFYKLQTGDGSTGKNNFIALDTLWVKGIRENERLTIGYCDKPGQNDGQIIGLVQAGDSLRVKILRAWLANTLSGVIEPHEAVEGIECLNEFYQNNNSQLSL